MITRHGRRSYSDGAKSLSRRQIETTEKQEAKAMDIFVLATGFGFFALMFGYIRVCERL